jgi:hypothetical protein
MITRYEAIQRLEKVAKEIVELKEAFKEVWVEPTTKDRTQVFLEKCGGWEDSRTVEEIIEELHVARSESSRSAAMLNDEEPL